MRRSSDDFKNNVVEVSKKLHFVAQTPRPRSDSTFLLLKKRRSGGGPEKLVKIKESAEISPENSSLPSSLVSGSHLSPLTPYPSPTVLPPRNHLISHRCSSPPTDASVQSIEESAPPSLPPPPSGGSTKLPSSVLEC